MDCEPNAKVNVTAELKARDSTEPKASTSATTKLAPGGVLGLDHLSNSDLLASTRRLVGRSNQLLAALLGHLAEVELRGIHRSRACSTLCAYCIYELRMSEDAASRRVAAARLVRRFPVLIDAIASGELHLTGLLMLGPHLTPENHVEVLARAKHRTKKELGQLVRILDPLPDVPPRIEPLGSAPARNMPSRPRWEDFIASTCPVRNLRPADRPRDWAPDSAPAAPNCWEASGSTESSGQSPPGLPARPELAPITGPQRYKVQFTATAEYVRLVEEAQALLSHALPNGALEEIHLRAMQALVAELKKRKYAVTAAPRQRAAGLSERSADRPSAPDEPSAANEPSGGEPSGGEPSGGEPSSGEEPSDGELFEDSKPLHNRAEHGRYIPAAVRRFVFERDGGRCSYVDTSGQRCPETHYLELHHLTAFARGGAHPPSNLALRCRPHNALAAEQDFGRSFMERKRRHEPGELQAGTNAWTPPRSLSPGSVADFWRSDAHGRA